MQLILAKGLTTAEDLRAAVDKLKSKTKDNIRASITVKAPLSLALADQALCCSSYWPRA